MMTFDEAVEAVIESHSDSDTQSHYDIGADVTSNNKVLMFALASVSDFASQKHGVDSLILNAVSFGVAIGMVMERTQHDNLERGRTNDMNNGNIQNDLETLAQARPYIRSLLAYVSYLRFGPMITVSGAVKVAGTTTVNPHYEMADKFIAQLEKDVVAG